MLYLESFDNETKADDQLALIIHVEVLSNMGSESTDNPPISFCYISYVTMQAEQCADTSMIILGLESETPDDFNSVNSDNVSSSCSSTP